MGRKDNRVANLGTLLNQPWPYLASAAFAVVILFYTHRKPHRPGVRWFSWLMGVYLIWSLAATFSTLTRSIPASYYLFVLQSVCPLVVTALELMVVLEYTGSEKWIGRRSLLLLFVPPLLFVVIALVFPEAVVSIEFHSGVQVIVGQQGLVKWGFYAYSAIIFLISSGVLLSTLMRAPAFWVPLLLLLLGAIFPVVGFALIRPEWITVPPVQVAILLTDVTMLTYFVALFGFRILQVIPVARDILISRMPYGLIVLDAENHLVDFNPTAQALPGLPGKLVLQRVASKGLGNWWGRLAPLIGPQPLAQDVTVQTDLRARIFHISSLPLLQASGWRLGQVFLIEDVTNARQAQQQQEQTQRSLATLQERERLARELHDSLAQTLAATHLQAGTARLFLAQGQTPETDECLEQMANMTLAAEVDVREYLLGAKTGFWAGQRFFPALHQYIVRFRQQYGLQVELIVPPQLEGSGLAPATEVQLMRIIQEALSNVRKHAHAKSIQVIFTDSERIVRIAIIDDGQGFDLALVKQRSEGFGLRSMRERAEALCGSFIVTSQPGQGTQVVVQVPLTSEGTYGEGRPKNEDIAGG